VDCLVRAFSPFDVVHAGSTTEMAQYAYSRVTVTTPLNDNSLASSAYTSTTSPSSRPTFLMPLAFCYPPLDMTYTVCDVNRRTLLFYA